MIWSLMRDRVRLFCYFAPGVPYGTALKPEMVGANDDKPLSGGRRNDLPSCCSGFLSDPNRKYPVLWCGRHLIVFS